MTEKKLLAICTTIPLIVGGLSSLLTAKAMAQFDMVNKPPLTPPNWVFPVVWIILYIMMGVASFVVYTSKKEPDVKNAALVAYGIQLFFNFWWSIIFFNAQWYLFAALWLFILWLLIITTITLFANISKTARNLMIPYLAWVTFALYLNLGVWFLN